MERSVGSHQGNINNGGRARSLSPPALSNKGKSKWNEIGLEAIFSRYTESTMDLEYTVERNVSQKSPAAEDN